MRNRPEQAWRISTRQDLPLRLVTGATSHPPQALEDAGGERLLSISRPEADRINQSAVEGYRGVSQPA